MFCAPCLFCEVPGYLAALWKRVAHMQFPPSWVPFSYWCFLVMKHVHAHADTGGINVRNMYLRKRSNSEGYFFQNCQRFEELC